VYVLVVLDLVAEVEDSWSRDGAHGEKVGREGYFGRWDRQRNSEGKSKTLYDPLNNTVISCQPSSLLCPEEVFFRITSSVAQIARVIFPGSPVQ
jgi:hypothetical protein